MVCTCCKVDKPTSAFYKRKDGVKGFSSWCKKCVKAQSKAKPRRPVIRIEVSERRCPCCKEVKSADQFFKNISRKDGLSTYCKECSREKGQPRDPRYMRNWHLKRKYGVSLIEYNRMLVAQQGRCAICNTTEASHHGVFYVDHNHTTGKIRALVCHRCNCALGLMDDDPERLEAAAAYLRRFQV